jgi:predicted amidophosphoribosyltransferase
MTASVSFLASCCDWHSHRHGLHEHAACVVCGARMPLVKRTFPTLGSTPEHVCARCALSVWTVIRAHRERPRFLRLAPVARRAPTTSHTNQATTNDRRSP